MSNRGRVSTYTDTIAEKICSQLSEGKTLSDICKEPGMPAVRTVSDWKAANETFAANFARAREDGFDVIADDCLKIADDHSRDVVEYEMEGGIKGTSVDYEVIQRSKLRVETRLKLLAKWSPKKYGDRIALDHSGITTVDFRDAE